MATLLQRAARELGAGPLLDRLGIEPADWWERQTTTAPPRDPTATRTGSMYMPEQKPVETPHQVAAHTRYSTELGPGLPELPAWPQETWLLKSFEVQLSGTMVTEDPLSFPKGTEELDVILALVQNGALVWSSSLGLPLLAVTGSEDREFTFSAGVFVDLVNGLPYRADSQLRFTVSGLAPAFALAPEPLDRFETESLEVQRQGVGVGQREVEVAREIAASGSDAAAASAEVAAQVTGLSESSNQQIELLEEIRNALEGGG